MTNEQTHFLDISWRGIFKVFIAVVFFYMLYLIRDILLWLVFALIISILFSPLINLLRRIRIPRTLAVFFVYIAFFGVLILIAYFTIPLFVSEIKQFSQLLPQYFEKISPPLKGLKIQAFQDIESFINSFGDILNKLTANIVNVLFVIFGGIFATLFILTLSIFLSLDERIIDRSLILFFPKKYESRVITIWNRCQQKISAWFFGRVISSSFVGFASFLTFLIFNTPYPFSLALISGILNFVPVVGPVVTGIFLVIIIGAENITKAIFVLIVLFLIHQIESNILTPLISKRLIGLPPILVLLSLSIGGILWGLLGAVLAIPLAGILYEFLREFLEKRKAEKPVIM